MSNYGSLCPSSLFGRICKLVCAIVGRAWPYSSVGHKCMVPFMAWDMRTNCGLPLLRTNYGLGSADELGPTDESSQRQRRSSQSAGDHLLGGWAIVCWAAVHLSGPGGGGPSVGAGAAIGSSRRRHDVSRNGSDGRLATDVTETAAAGGCFVKK